MTKYKLCFAILAFLCLADAGLWAQKTRHYYIQAEDVIWDFAPSNQNLVHGGAIPEPWTNSHVFPMVRYIQYTDASFSTPKPQPSWLGILGPIIRAEVGDEVVVLFRNRAFKAGGNYGMHPHGFRYTKDNEGAHYIPAGAGAEVPPGGQFEYHWFADEDSGPGLGDPSSLVWWYHSHVNEPQETNLGLLGPIIITRRGMARADGSPRDVNREFVTAFFIFNELNGEEPGLMHSINGYIFGNLRGLDEQWRQSTLVPSRDGQRSRSPHPALARENGQGWPTSNRCGRIVAG